MSTTFADIPLEQINTHPLNIRRTAEADDDMVASIRVHGLLEPLVVAPDPDGGAYYVIAGHRRLDGCRKAGLPAAPAVVRDDLVTDAQVIEAMLVENGHRKDLTPVEEAEGYEQLQLFGYKPKDIAAAVGRPVATVKSRLKLGTLPEATRDRLHDGQLTLADAEDMLAFADQPEVIGRLEQAVGAGNFRYELSRAKQEREQQARRERIAQEIAAGIAFDRFEPDGDWPTWDRDNGPCPAAWTGLPEAASHVDCGRIYWPSSPYADPQLVCTAPGRHPKPERHTDDVEARRKADEEFERQQAARQAEHASRVAAARVRVDHLMKHFTGLYTSKKVTPEQLAALRVTVPMQLSVADGSFDPDAYMHAMGLDPATSWWSICDVHATEITASTAKFLKAYAALQAAQVEGLLSDPALAGSAAAWGWLESTSYELSDIDKELRDEAVEEGAA